MDDDGIDVAFAHAPGDDLRVLRAEIQDDNFFRHDAKKIFPAGVPQGERKMFFSPASSGKMAGVMSQRIRRWLAAHPRWTLSLLVVFALGPFLAKPFNIDDPLFIRLAQHVQAHPENPFDFDVNWYGLVSPMWTVTENPPLAGYYFALAGSLFGWSEISLHFAGLLAALAVVLGTHRLASRLCGNPLLAAGATLLTPVFLVSASTVMCDVLMLAFWVWAIVFWVEGLEQNRSAKMVTAGLLIALAMLTKYFGVALIPLLAVHGALQKRQLGGWAAALVIPLATFGAYQWLTHSFYGHAMFSSAIQFVAAAHRKQGFSPVARGVIALAFTGGAAASTVFLAPWLWRARTLVVVIGATALAGGTLVSPAVCCKNTSDWKTPPRGWPCWPN